MSPLLTDHFLFQRKWSQGIFGSKIGISGIVPVDINNDGRQEFIVGGSKNLNDEYNNYWYIMEWIEDAFQITYTSKFYPAGIKMITTYNDKNNKTTIVVVENKGMIRFINGESKQPIEYASNFLDLNTEIKKILFADVTDDAKKEIIILTEDNIQIRHFESSTSFDLIIDKTASDIAIGNVDKDSHNEIVLSTGYVIQINADSYTTEWDNSQLSFGKKIALIDIDNDKQKEIISESYAFKMKQYEMIWNRSQTGPSVFYTQDLNKDGIDEIITVSNIPVTFYEYLSVIYVLDAVTGKELWSKKIPQITITDLIVQDVNQDNQPEIIFSAKYDNSNPAERWPYRHSIFVYDASIQQQEWQSPYIEGFYYSANIADIDGDGIEEIIAMPYDSELGKNFIYVYDAQTYQLKWKTETGLVTNANFNFSIYDLDQDGFLDIFVAQSVKEDYTKSEILVIDGKTHKEKTRYLLESQDATQITALKVKVVDINNDETAEIIVSGYLNNGGFIHIINSLTSEVIWKSSLVKNKPIHSIVVADANQDGIKDIIATPVRNGEVVGNSLFVNGKNYIEQLISNSDFLSVMVKDIDGDGTNEIIGGNEKGEISVINGKTLMTEKTQKMCSDPVDALNEYNLPGAKNHEILAACGDNLVIYQYQKYAYSWYGEGLNIRLGSPTHTASVIKTGIINGKNSIIVGSQYTAHLFQKIEDEQRIDLRISAQHMKNYGDLNSGIIRLTIRNHSNIPAKSMIIGLSATDTAEIQIKKTPDNMTCNYAEAPQFSCMFSEYVTPINKEYIIEFSYTLNNTKATFEAFVTSYNSELTPDDNIKTFDIYAEDEQNTKPLLEILSPQNQQSLWSEMLINFKGKATDKEEGDLSSKIKWHSSIDGDLGTGQQIQFALSEGEHTITATVADKHYEGSIRMIQLIIKKKTAAGGCVLNQNAEPDFTLILLLLLAFGYLLQQRNRENKNSVSR